MTREGRESPGPTSAAVGGPGARYPCCVNALDVVYLGVGAVTAPFWARKQRGGWGERFGRTPALPPGDERGGRILLHGVSVGEVNALRHLVPTLTGEARVIVSASTDTGLARATSLYASTCDVVRYPLDASFAVRRFLDAVRPEVVVLVELELWPNFMRECAKRGVPVCVINGRLSARSFKGYQKLRRWVSPMFRQLEFAAVQDEDYAGRFEAMGVATSDCLLTGSMKWDAAQIADEVGGASALAADMGIDRSRPLIVAGSTGPGEEALLHGACPSDVQLLCAPRKPERFDEAASALGDCVRRSSGETRRADRYLLDTIGELRAAYALADLIVIGRSFGDLYGSDPIEPAALGKACVIGPAVSDFARIVEALEAEGGIVRVTRDDLAGTLAALMADASRRGSIGEAGRACVRAHQGASARHAELVLHELARLRT